MSGSISSGIGLVSGLPINSIIDQLIAIQGRPLSILQNRVAQVKTQRTVLAEVSARLLGLQSAIARFDEPAFFRASSAVSSDDSVLTAVAEENAAQGTFQFQVRSLVSNHQIISSGFANSDSQPVGLGTLSLELGNARLDRETTLDRLNGGNGVRRGTIEITDSSGARAVVDLTTVLSVRDVVSEINSRTDVAVSARVENDHLVIEDQSGGNINIRDLAGGHAAADLGIAQNGDGAVVGTRIVFLTNSTRLTELNDGNGVGIGTLNQDIQLTVGDRTYTVGLRNLLNHHTHFDQLNNGDGVRNGTIRITNRAGQSADIVIDDEVQTIGDAINAIEGAGLNLDVSLGAVSGQLSIRDDSVPANGTDPARFKIEDVTGHAGADLGILADTDQDLVKGSDIYRVDTLGDVLRAINFAVDATDPNNVVRNEDVVATINAGGRGIELNSAEGSDFTLASGETGSTAAAALGLVGSSDDGRFVARDTLAGLDTVLLSTLRGGRGINLGEVKLTDAAGNNVNIDLFSDPPATVQELIDRINTSAASAATPVGVVARLNDAGNGILFEDTSGGSGATRLKDVGSEGTTVADLFGLPFGDVQAENGRLDTGNTQLQYVASATPLSEMNQGRGVTPGRFVITAATGQTITVNLTENQKTVGDVIQLINALTDTIGVEARINGNGDGIELIDSSGGTGTFSVADTDGGRAASNLNIAGEGTTTTVDGATQQKIDGSFEFEIQIDADDTLSDVRDKIDALNIDAAASIVNDGSGASPFHLVISSQVSGRNGRIVVDAGSTGLAFDTLVEAQDAVVFFGGAGAADPIVLTSSTNTLTGVLENVTIDLVGTSNAPVELSVSRDIDRIVSDLNTFVSNYNSVLDSLDENTRFDAETGDRGVLFGDNTVDVVRSRLRNVVTARVPEAPAGLDRLVLIGVKSGNGGRLSFDENKFRELFNANPDAVEALFTTEDSGIGDRLNNVLEGLTSGFDGVIARRDGLLGKREDLFNDRISALEDSLARKRQRLQRQFQGLESALANLQGAQSALGVIANASVGTPAGG